MQYILRRPLGELRKAVDDGFPGSLVRHKSVRARLFREHGVEAS
jgi:hypothetical protein